MTGLKLNHVSKRGHCSVLYMKHYAHIDGLMQDCSISIADALEIL